MRAITRIISVLIVGFSALFVASTAAYADTPNCVSRTEYRRVDRGMTIAQVNRIFDISGRITSTSSYGGNKDQWREYRVCSSWGNPRWSNVSVNFDNYMAPKTNRDNKLRVYGKSASIIR